MIRPDTTKYRLLEMIGMCGEFPADQLNRLIPSASYAEKLITDLKAEHLIRTHYRDALRGYRLTKAAKEMLLRQKSDIGKNHRRELCFLAFFISKPPEIYPSIGLHG